MLHFLVVSRYKLLSVVGNAEKKTEKITKKRERKKKVMKKREYFFSEMELEAAHMATYLLMSHM
jgi:hypothetical protein